MKRNIAIRTSRIILWVVVLGSLILGLETGAIDFKESDAFGQSENEFDAQNNLILNAGFEEGVGPSGTPLYWIDQWSSVLKLLDQTEKHSGNYSWRFDNDGTLYSGAYSDFIPVEQNIMYELSVWVKCHLGVENIIIVWEEFSQDKSSLFIYYTVFDSRYASYIGTTTDWTQYTGRNYIQHIDTKYIRIRFFGPYNNMGTAWWDDFSFREAGNEYLPAYGVANEIGLSETVKFGDVNSSINEHWIQNIDSYMSDPYSDPNGNNISCRDIEAGKTVTIEFPSFNVDDDGFPLSPMLLEIMYKDVIKNEDIASSRRTYDLVYAYSKIDYLNLDPDYLGDTNYLDPDDRDYGLVNMGGRNDNKWKYVQYAFQKSQFQLLRAINGMFTIKIVNATNYRSPSYDMPIDYVSLRKVTDGEYKALTDRQREFAGFYEVELPSDTPSPPVIYGDPDLTIFARDVMRPVYKHTKPASNEIDKIITGFSCWGELEPLSLSIYSENGIEDLTLGISDLVHSQNGTSVIDRNNIYASKIVYAESRFTYTLRRGYGLLPDHIEEFTTLSIDPDTSQRIWLEVVVPEKGANLKSGMYQGTVTVKQNGVVRATVPIEFSIYDVELLHLQADNYVYHDPFQKVYSSDLSEVFRLYRETQFDAYIGSRTHRMSVLPKNTSDIPPIDPNDIFIDTNLFETALDIAIEEDFLQETGYVLIPAQVYYEAYKHATGNSLSSTSPYYWDHLSDERFVEVFGMVIQKYMTLAESRDKKLILHVSDEPGSDPFKRILVDRIYTIIKAFGGLTSCTYYDNCDLPLYLDPDDEVNNPNAYIVPGGIVPPLTELVDYKVWAPSNLYSGYNKHKNPDYHGNFGYYTTGHSHYRNPVYNRFLHGLFAFATDSTCVAAYAMGDYIGDAYNDFDARENYIFPFSYPDFIYAYPTWSGKLLPTMGGAEGIREGIKDAKYIMTLKSLIMQNLGPIAHQADVYLSQIKSSIDIDYITAYSSQANELGYYHAIVEVLSEANDPDDYEVFSRIRKNIADYIGLAE